MTHTERKAKIDQLLADNTNGDISAADLREVETMTSQDLQSTEDNTQVALNRINDLELDTSGQHLLSANDVEVPKQVLDPDPAHTVNDNRLITVANAFEIELALKQYTEQHFIEKGVENLVVGDRTGEAQVTLDAKTGDASHVVFKRQGVPKSSMGVIASTNDELIIEQRANEDIKFILPAGQTIAAKIGHEWFDMMKLARPTVVAAYSATPTADELKTAIKTVPHFSDWEGDMDFYIRDNPQTKMVLVKYRGVTGNTEASPGLFFFEKLTKAV